MDFTPIKKNLQKHTMLINSKDFLLSVIQEELNIYLMKKEIQ